jgi:hypothetical protein
MIEAFGKPKAFFCFGRSISEIIDFGPPHRTCNPVNGHPPPAALFKSLAGARMDGPDTAADETASSK